MADKTTIAIEVEVDGVEQSIKSVKDLKNAIKDAKDEQIKAASAFGQGSQEYQNASKKLGELKDSMDDLNDSTQSLRGSGVESLSSSFGMLGDGFKNLDLDKIKTGFKGLGSAMNAIPLMLLVSGITMLVEKFGIFEMITDLVVQAIYAFTDAIGLTNKADEKAAAEMIENSKKVQVAKEEQYNSEIKKAQAAGQSTKQLELDKLKSTEDSIAKQVEAMKDLQIKKGKLNDEEQKNYDELQINLLKASGDREAKEIANNKAKVDEINAYNTLQSNIAEDLRVAKLSEREKEIDAIRKAAAAKLKELNDKEVFDYQKSGKAIEAQIKSNEETKKQINELAQIEINKINAKYNAEAAEKRKAAAEKEAAETLARQKSLEEAQLSLTQVAVANKLKVEDDGINNLVLVLDKATQKKIDDAHKEKLQAEWLEKNKYDLAKQGLQSVQGLSDIYFLFKTQNLEKGSKAELDAAKKQFNINKALQIASATIAGVQGVQNALTEKSILPAPLSTAFRISNAIVTGIASAANIAKIAASKFEGGGGGATGGGGGGGGGGGTPMPSIPAPPTIATSANNTNQTTSFDESGKNLDFKQPQINVTATVGVDEIANKTNRVSVLEQQSTF